MRPSRSVVLVSCLILVGGSFARGAARPEVILKLGHGLDTMHPVHKAMVFMAEKVREKSGGRMRVEIFPSEQLGNEKECIEALQLGYLAMTKTSGRPPIWRV
jgi:TRAP-type C4-dicarboxylate transport system substrate-binding protein